MLATYQAKIVNNQIEWIDTPPDFDDVYVTVTVFPNFLPKTEQTNKPKRQMPAILKGRGREIGDIFDTSESYADWNPMP